MKAKISRVLAISSIFLLVACSSENNGTESSTFTVTTPESSLKLGVEKNSKKEVSFSCPESWKASVNVDWATVSPMTGTAGKQDVKIIAKTYNNTGKSVKAYYS